MHRMPLLVANWKMHTTASEALILARQVADAVEHVDHLQVVLLPPVIWLPTLVEDLHHRPRPLSFGVQNFYPASEGSFTGEIGIDMLTKLVRYLMIGHSERRALFHEDHQLINQKVQAALIGGFWPILCIGELTPVMLKQRGRGRPTSIEHKSDLFRQLDQALAGITTNQMERLTICYEPLWAISPGRVVLPVEAQAVLEQLRRYLHERFGQVANRIRLLYGGGVTGDNAADYLKFPDVDGLLVGTASLSMRTFRPILDAFIER